MNIGNIKANANGALIGRITTMSMAATIGLREVQSTNDQAPSFDVLALSADKTSWVKVGALWEYFSNATGEAFYSGRIDDPSMDKPLDVSLFAQPDGSYNVTWRRPQRKQPVMASNDTEMGLPPMNGSAETNPETGESAPTGDGLGESTASMANAA